MSVVECFETARAPVALGATEASWLERLADGASAAELGEGALDFCGILVRQGIVVRA